MCQLGKLSGRTQPQGSATLQSLGQVPNSTGRAADKVDKLPPPAVSQASEIVAIAQRLDSRAAPAVAYVRPNFAHFFDKFGTTGL